MKLTDKIKYALLGDKPNKKTGLRPIEEAAKSGDMEAVKYYLAHGSAVKNKSGRHFIETPGMKMNTLRELMTEYSFPKETEKRKKLIKDTMFSDLKSLNHENVMFCRLNGVSMGIVNGEKNKKPITLFTQEGRSEEQKKLWMQFAHKDQIAHEFRSAALYNNVEDMKLLYKSKKVSVDMPNKTGKTAAWYACFKGNLDAATLLLGWGANMNPHDDDLQTPFSTAESIMTRQRLFQLAIKYGDIYQVRQLVKAGANLKDTSLMEFADTPERMDYLLRHGAPYKEYLSQLERADRSRESMEPAPYQWKMNRLREQRQHEASGNGKKTVARPMGQSR